MDNFEINTKLKRKLDVIVDCITNEIRIKGLQMFNKCTIKRYINAMYFELKFIYDKAKIVNWVSDMNLIDYFEIEKNRIKNEVIEELVNL